MTKFELIESRLEEVKQDYGNMLNTDLTKKYGVSIHTIYRVFEKHNIPRNKQKILDKIDHNSLIIDYLNNMSIKEIEEKYNTSRFTIANILRIHNVTQDRMYRKYNFNEHYFDNIDTEHKAYWLGFLYADGNNSNYTISIVLQERDKYILDKFKEDVRYNGELSICHNRNYCAAALQKRVRTEK